MRLYLTMLYLILVAVFAIRRGDEPERWVAGCLLASAAVDGLYHLIAGPAQFVTVDPGHLVIDASMLVLLMWVALRANRGWPLWACSAQVIVMLGHIGKLFELRDVYRGYWAMTQMPVLLQLAFLAIGTWAHVGRRKAIGPYHSWRLG